MSDAVIARRYAKALFDLATSQSMVVKFQDQLQRVSQAAELVPNLLEVLGNDRTPLGRRLVVMDGLGAALQLDPLVLNFCKVLVEKRRLGCWPSIVEAFAQLTAKSAGLVKVEVTTATPLASKEITERLTRALAHLTHKNVDLQMGVNEDLIGGAVVRIDDTIYDGSIRRELKRLREKLNATVMS
jgi:F-type H+-transporting ATPase subunit delta